MKVLCVMGKYQYGDPQRGLGTEYEAFIPALKKIGCNVVHFESWNRNCYQNFRELNLQLLETVEKEKPDVMLCVQMNYEIWVETLEFIKSREDVATICWTTDDSWKFREVSRFLGKHYHAMTTTYPYMVQEYKKNGIHNVLLTQWASGVCSLKEPLPASQCRYPVTFIGAAHGKRKEWVDTLKEKGIDIQCFGYGWPAGPVNNDKMYTIINESQVSLNFANSRGDEQLKARTFEVPGAGGFLITERVRNLQHYYKLGEEIETFDNLEELATKVKYYLEHPDERDNIAVAGYRRTLLEHTYDLRLKEVLEYAIIARDEYNRENKVQLPLNFMEKASENHQTGKILTSIALVLKGIGVLIWGKQRGPRAARRLVYEISWRIAGAKTYSSCGLPGRLFYHES